MPEQVYKFLKSNTVGIIGVPFSGGQVRRVARYEEGVEEGPVRLVEAGLIDQLKSMDWAVDFEDLRVNVSSRPPHDPDSGKLKRPRYVSAVTKAVAEQVKAQASRGNMVLTLGGDHSIAIGTVAGIFTTYPEACLIWIDAHA
ncbi:arginase type II, partial [Jimgerdemannia flammicorona]